MLSDQLASVLPAHGVVVAYVFGSRATGRERAGSDLDLAILTDRDLSLRDQVRLGDDVALTAGISDVDVVLLDDASLELRGHVVQSGRCVFSRDETRRVAFEVRTLKEYLEFAPELRRLTDSYLRRVAASAR